MIETTDTTKPRRARQIIKGELMVEPVAPMTIDGTNGPEIIRPGRDRLSPDHRAVKKQPSAFRVVDRSDKRTRRELERMQRRSSRSGRSSGYGLGPPSQPRGWL
jgi:hypothetical protein